MKGGKVKKGSCKNRGYIGYHTTWDNKRFFLRSKAEFIYAKMLDIEKIPYKIECATYEFRGIGYKPDFFIFDHTYSIIKKIVEIKGQDDKKIALKYLDNYKQFFNSLGIHYEVIWNFRGIITKYNLKNDIENWIQRSLDVYDFVSDVSGQNNPMYGKTHKSSTIEIIKQKAIQRQTQEYRDQNSKRLKEFFQSESGIKRRQQISEQRKLYSIINNPIVSKSCKKCGNIFQSKQKTQKQFCSSQCLRSWSYKNIPNYGVHSNKNKLNK
jgi:hypothetical protein